MALQGEWKLSGGVWTDTSGNSYDLTEVGTMVQDTGFLGGANSAVSQNAASGNYLKVANPANISKGLTALSVVGRYYMNSHTAVAVSLLMGAATNQLEFAFVQNTDGTFNPRLSTSGTAWTTDFDSATALSDATWYDIAFVWDGSNAYIYIDDMATADASTAATGTLYDGTGDLYLFANTGGGNAHKGRWDDVRIYDSALNQTEREAALALGQDFVAIPTPTTTGGFVLGGSSTTISIEAQVVTSGGFVLGGSESSVLSGNSVEHTTSGGFVLGGSSSTIGVITSVTTTGGFVLGGTGSSLATFTVANYQDILWGLFTGQGDAITGAAPTVKLYYETTGQLFDFHASQLSFKASGWSTLADTMTEIDATNLAGYYKTRLEVSTFSDGRYDALMTYAAGTPKQNTGISFSILDGEVVDQYAAAQAVANGVSIAAVPAAVVAADNAQVIDGTKTRLEVERIALAALAGKRVGLGTATEEYMGQNGTTPRIKLTPDANGNGTPVLDGS